MRWLLAILVCGVLGCSAGSAPKETCGVHHLDLKHQDHDHKELEALAEGARHRHGVYMATLAVGTPGQDFDVIIDTGSANLVVMGRDCAECTGVDYRSADSSTAQDTSADFSLQYGSASLVAKVVKDLTGLPCGERVEVVFGHATEVAHLPASILGLAYAALAAPVSAPVQPWLDAMVKAGGVADLFSLRLCGPGKSGSHLKLGGVDSSVDLDGVEYTPVVEERYYAVAPPTFTVDCTSSRAGSATTIIDPGTTLVLVPYGVHEAFVTKLKAVAPPLGSLIISPTVSGRAAPRTSALGRSFPRRRWRSSRPWFFASPAKGGPSSSGYRRNATSVGPHLETFSSVFALVRA